MPDKIYKLSLVAGLIAMPLLTGAEQLGQTKTLLQNARNIVTQTLIPLVFTLALLFFFWGVAKYIWSAGNEKEEGKKIMIWGVVALFIMASVWGIVRFMQEEFLNSTSPDSLPVPTIGGSSGGSTFGTD